MTCNQKKPPTHKNTTTRYGLMIDSSSYGGWMLVKLPNLHHHYHCDQKSSEGHVVICERIIHYYGLIPSEATAAAAAAYRQEIKILRETFD